MEQIIGPLLAFIIMYLALPKGDDVPRGTIQADFDEKIKDYKEEHPEVVQCIAEKEEVPTQGICGPNKAFFALPAHLADKVDDVKIGDKWVKVVELSFIEVLKPQNHE